MILKGNLKHLEMTCINDWKGIFLRHFLWPISGDLKDLLEDVLKLIFDTDLRSL